MTTTELGTAQQSAQNTSEQKKKRYAIVGLGSRARMFTRALAGSFKDSAALVGLCDISPTRIEWHNQRMKEEFGYDSVPGYSADDFEKMLAEQNVDCAIVTTHDAAHHEYIIRAMRAGCDVIVEKPLTIDAEKARLIQEVVKETGKELHVTFNVRYQPLSTKVRELIAEGAIGKPLSVSYTYTLDTKHGADYFRRWHREKDKSGGLLVHKSTHHFDLVNWLIDSEPEEVFAYGDLKFYGKQAAAERGEKYDYDRYTGAEQAAEDPFALRLDEDHYTRSLYLNAEKESGYIRDRNVFGEGITSEDTLAVLTRFKNGVIMNYSLIAYSPKEGYELYITGTKGRIELKTQRSPHVLGDEHQADEDVKSTLSLRVYPMFKEPYDVEVETVEGGHGGGDTLMLQHLFDTNTDIADPLGRRASLRDGLTSLGLGVAANESIATGKPIRVTDVIPFD